MSQYKFRILMMPMGVERLQVGEVIKVFSKNPDHGTLYISDGEESLYVRPHTVWKDIEKVEWKDLPEEEKWQWKQPMGCDAHDLMNCPDCEGL